MFPPGWPGVGLLLLRVAVAARAVTCAVAAHGQLPGCATVSLFALALVVGVGILTPVASVLVIIVQLAVARRLGLPDAYDAFVSVLVATALAALGPGAYSVDARRFGRRIVLVARGHGGPS